jgi:hypothetical protein
MIDHAMVGAGRTGVGLGRGVTPGVKDRPDGSPAILVFDKNTHAFLGLAGGDGTDGRMAGWPW